MGFLPSTMQGKNAMQFSYEPTSVLHVFARAHWCVSFFGLFLFGTLSLEGNSEKTSGTSSRLGPKNDQPKTR